MKGQKVLCLKEFGKKKQSTKFWGSKQFLGLKNLEDNFDSKIFWVPKSFGSENILRLERFLAPENVQFKKMFGSSKFWAPKYFQFHRILSSKKFWFQNF